MFDNFDNIKWDIIKQKINKANVIKVSDKKGSYLDISVSFDTETTSTYVDEDKFAFMYVWQFGIDGYYCYGRTWAQFINLCSKLQSYGELSKDKKLIIYIHNLSFEFQFFRKYFNWINVFATDKREPIKALCTYGIEFRDSLILSGYKLENVANNLETHKVKKLVGDLDYSLVRNSKTTFTEKELGYMKHDVEILVDYIDEQREQYGDITKIPLTNTGRVRNLVRKECYGKNKYNRSKYYKYIKNLTLDSETYLELKQAFAGGFTHGNPKHIGKTYHNVSSIDFTSSYPTVMISEKYPVSQAFNFVWQGMERFNELCDKRLVIFQVEFTDLISKIEYDNYISKSKAITTKGVTENNGRVYSADYLSIVITNIDWEIIKKTYDWSNIRITRIKYFYKNYLPKPIIQSIVNLYKTKTTLKNVDGKHAEYMHAKGMLNSVYGMCVTDIVKDENTYIDDWQTKKANADEIIDKYNKSRNRFLFYPWGVFVTAYARRNLWSGILNIKDDYIYSDTDSIKMLNYDKHKQYVVNYNKEIHNKLAKAMEYHKLDINDLEPKTVKGVKKPLGVWDFEGTYTRFKTLGAKRYIFDVDDNLEVTVAGLGKKAGREYLLKISNNDIKKVYHNFTNNLTIPSEYTSKLTHTYIDDEKSYLIQDYQGNVARETALSSVHLEKASFTMSLTQEFEWFIQQMAKGQILVSLDKYAKGV